MKKCNSILLSFNTISKTTFCYLYDFKYTFTALWENILLWFMQTVKKQISPQGRIQKDSEGGGGVDLILLPYLLYVVGQTGLRKQCRPRSDAAERGVWSGSTLFATQPAILHTFTGSKMDFLKRSIRKSVPNLSKSKIPHENETESRGVQMNHRTPSEFAPAPPSHTVWKGSLLYVDIFYSIQWFCKRTLKALTRLRSRPSMSSYTPKPLFQWRVSIIKRITSVVL